MPDPTNVSSYGTIRTKYIQTQRVKSGYIGGVDPSCLSIRAPSIASAEASTTHFTEMKLCYGVTGTSTLDFIEYSGGTVSRDAENPNVSIRGCKTAPDGDNYIVATKKYVDDKITNYIIVKEPVHAYGTGNLTTFNYNPASPTGLGTLTCDPGGPIISADAGTSTIVIDGTTINVGDRILLTVTTGGGAAVDSDGVYELISVGGGSPAITLQRPANMALPLEKGTFVLVDSGSINAGKGYYLNALINNTSTARPWLLFSTTTNREFDAPITQLASGNYTVTSAPDGSDEKALLVATADGSSAQWNYTVGLAGQVFGINCTNFNLNEEGNFENISTAVDIIGGDVAISTNTDDGTIHIDSTGGANKYYANINRFAKVTGGTVAIALSTLTKDVAVAGGHLTPLTSQFSNTSSTEDYGAGVFFDCENADSNTGGTNNNQNRFAILPGKTSDNLECNLNVIHWDATGNTPQIVATMTST